MQVQKECAQTSTNANASDNASQSALTPKTKARAKKHALKPTKRAFSERQITAFRDKSHASASESQENKQGDNLNAFKSDEAEQRGQEYEA